MTSLQDKLQASNLSLSHLKPVKPYLNKSQFNKIFDPYYAKITDNWKIRYRKIPNIRSKHFFGGRDLFRGGLIVKNSLKMAAQNSLKQLAVTVHGPMFGRAYQRKENCDSALGGSM